MSEEEIKMFMDIYISGFEMENLVQCLDFFTFEHFGGPDVTMEDITALHGLVAAFRALSKQHTENINVFEKQLMHKR